MQAQADRGSEWRVHERNSVRFRQRRGSALAPTILAGLGSVGILSAIDSDSGRVLALAVVLILLLLGLARRAGFVCVMAGGLALTAAAAYLLHGYVVSSDPIVAQQLPVSQSQLMGALSLFMLASVSMLLGASLFCFGGRPASLEVAIAKNALDSLIRRLRAAPGKVLLITAVPPMLIVIGSGGASLLNRSTYLDKTGGIAICYILGASVAPIAIVLLGILTRSKFGATFAASVLLFIYIALQLAGATRALALTPLLIYSGRGVARTGPARSRAAFYVGLVAALVFSIALLKLPLYLRGLPEQGLAPYLRALSASPVAFLHISNVAPIGGIAYGLPLAASVAFLAPPISQHLFVTSINPLPSVFTDWGRLHSTLAVNSSVPFNGIGELGNQGKAYVIAYFFAIGLLLQFVVRRTQGFAPLARLAGQTITGALALLFLLNMLSYNLRSGTRYAYYILAFHAIASVTSSRTPKGEKASAPARMR